MFHFIENKKFLRAMRNECSDLINMLKVSINNGSYLRVSINLVGSGAKDLITQNNSEPVDLDYNICILEVHGSKKEKDIKEYIKKSFNKVLKKKGWGDCSDSKSALTTPLRKLNGYKTKFSIDLAIIKEKNNKWYRLIHEKTGNTNLDKWYWNEGILSKKINDKVEWLKTNNCWMQVRERYLEKKNRYLSAQDQNHTSFVCYIETINEIYDSFNSKVNGKSSPKKQIKSINASLNMKYGDSTRNTFYCSYVINGKKEVKSPLYNNNTTTETDFHLVMRWLNKLTTAISKDKNITKVNICISKYISSMIFKCKIGNRDMNEEEINLIRSYNGRVNKLEINVTFQLNND